VDIREQIREDADRCVLCGLCLPHCPTYRLSHDEAESPRGRISLMQALAAGRLPADAALAGHLERCLGCRSCETMCPSRVPYSRLLTNGRALLRAEGVRWPVPLRPLLEGPSALRRGARGALRLYQMSGLERLQRTGAPMLPPRRPLPHCRLPAGPRRGTVALFTGCTGEFLDQETLHAAIILLHHLGYAVHLPKGQGCCGALAGQAGDAAGAERLAARNRAAFSEPYDAVLGVASGCIAPLREAGVAVTEITTFLAGVEWGEAARPAPLVATAALHLPCSLRNGGGAADAPRRLLKQIPRLDLLELPPKGCCGGAGTYPLTQRESARALREPWLETLRDSPASLLLSANIGCALHLGAGLREAGIEMEVIHPVTLLARQLRTVET